MAALPGGASATSYFGTGNAYFELRCTASTHTVAIDITMYTTAVPQSIGYNLYYWGRTATNQTWRWIYLVSGTDTPASVLGWFHNSLTFYNAAQARYFKTEYFWYTVSGWRQGSPASEQTSINC